MTSNGIVQLRFYLVMLTALAIPLGAFMARVVQHQGCANTPPPDIKIP